MTIMVAEAGFEPTTSRLWASRAARLLFSAVCPFRGIPSMQYARLKAYPSLRTVERTIGNEPTRHPTGQLGVMLCACIMYDVTLSSLIYRVTCVIIKSKGS